MPSRFSTKFLLAVLLVTGVFGSGLFVAKPVLAQGLPVFDAGANAGLIGANAQLAADKALTATLVAHSGVQTTKVVKQSAWEVLKISLTNTAAIALLNGVNYFAQKIAYDAAVYIASGGAGQKPFFTTEGLGNYLKNTGADAAGEMLGTLTTDPATFGKFGINLCVPKTPTLALNFKLGFLNGLPGILGKGGPNPPKPKCSWDTISSNWDSFANQDSSTVLNNVGIMFSPGESSLGAAIQLNNVTMSNIAEKKLASYGDYLANKGFKPVKDFISGQVKTPASVVQHEMEASLDQSRKAKDQSVMITGHAFGAGAFAILPAALQTFAGTLSEQLLKKVFTQGLITVSDLLGGSDDVTLKFDAAPSLGGRPAAELANASLLTPKILSVTNYNALTDFVTCPDEGRSTNHCVIDTQFYNAVTRADQDQALTVRQAVTQGMLNRNWQLLPLAHRKNNEATCYKEAFCYSNLVKLRLARVLPIGWEMAANSPFNDLNRPVTLGEAMDRFEDCPRNSAGDVDPAKLPDPLHPWCHMVDPEWVLKYPTTICRQLAPGPILLTPQSAARTQSCVDATSCLGQDVSGNCNGGYGYCVREKSVWKLDADACPAQYSSCTAYKRVDGASFAFLANTLDAGPCNAQNAGCRQYSLSSNAIPNGGFEDLLDGLARDWTLSAGARLHRSGVLSTHGMNAVGVLAGNGASVPVPSLLPNQPYTLSAAAIQELEGTSAVGTVRLSFLKADGSAVDPSTLATTCQADPLGRFVTFSISTTALGSQGGSCTVTAPPGATNARIDISSNAPAAGNRTWFDDIALFGAAFSASPYDGIFLNSQAAKCAANDAGCTQFVRIATGTLNLVRNPGFESVDAVTGKPSFWEMDATKYEKDAFKGFEGANNIVLSPTAAVQDVRGLLSDAAYSFSVSTRYDGTAAAPTALATIQLYDTNTPPQPISPATVTDCTISGSSMRVNLAVGDLYERASCSFTTPSNVSFARVILTSSSSSERVLADGVQIELSVGATAYHEAYAGSSQRITLKKAPEGLDCSGTNRSAECEKYAPSCQREEVGCNAYTPVDGGTMITAVTTANDLCPAECAGYDTFRQEPTQFNDPRFPLFLIPASAKSCTASEAGCSEFTNIEKLAQGGESREYFTYLRLCTKPDDQSGTFYTWEGNDVRGFQLRSWSLRKSNLISAAGDTDPTGGTGPCSKLAYDGAGQPHCADDAASVTAAACTKDDMTFNPDCREFYDVEGNIHYRLYSKTIISSDSCKEYRITKSTETECRDHGGHWQNSECRYLAYSPESLTCAATSNDCRAYSGNASRNIRVSFNDDFEQGTTADWSSVAGGGSSFDVVNSNEAVSAGGHSLKVTRADVTKNVAAHIQKGQSYIVTFWAKGTGDLTVRLSQAGDQGFTFNRTTSADAPVSLSTEWRPYQVGPVEAVRDANIAEQLIFQRLGGGAPLFFLDNIEFREITDDVYLIEDTWNTPLSCDQAPNGSAAPQYMLGCRAYTDRKAATSTFKSFEKLCRAAAVGCEALYNTRNSASPFAQTFRAVCSISSACIPGATLTCPCAVGGAEVCQVTKGQTSCRYDVNDEVPASRVSPTGDTVRVASDAVEYLVDDDQFRCDADAMGCTAMGDRYMNSERTAVDTWKTVYLKNVPADYAATLCNEPELYCQAYTRRADAAPVFFKDPEARVCEFREGATAGSRGWFKKGSNEPCDPNFLEAGDRFGIWRNSDLAYDGWAGECASQHDMCKEFIDPVATSTAYPRGTPYYAIMNDRLDTTTCQNRVSLNESPSGATSAAACVLFWQTDNLTKIYSASATYALSDEQRGALVPPQPGSDTNIIIRVQRDRQCGEWLDCRSSESVFNPSTGQVQNVCTSYSLCAEFERVGNTTRCLRYVDSAYSGKTLSEGVYESRVIGAAGMEFSGFAIPNRYPVDELVTANVGTDVKTPDMRLVRVGSTCSGAYGSACGPAADQGTCLGPTGSRLCVYPVDGGRRVTTKEQLNQPQIISGYPGASCRAYPQEDAPFPSAVADPNGWDYEAAEINNGNPILISPAQAFTGANVCQRRLINGVEVSSCECNYVIATYGSEKKYFPAANSDLPSGYCTGGAFDGHECDPLTTGARTKNNLSCCSKSVEGGLDLFSTGCSDGGQCVRLNKMDRVVGYEGQCLERDMTRPINGTSDQFACLTWRPVGLIGGSRDIYNQNLTAGYFASSDRRFYCVGDHPSWALRFNIPSATTSSGNLISSDTNGDGEFDHRDMDIMKFFGPGKVSNGVASARSAINCEDQAAGKWCIWPSTSSASRKSQMTGSPAIEKRCASSSECASGFECIGAQGTEAGRCLSTNVEWFINPEAYGILGCYEVADEGGVAETFIDYPYIGPPLYRQQLSSIYFQLSDDLYDRNDPDAGEIATGDTGSGPAYEKITTNPHQNVFGDCNDEEDDNIDNDDNDSDDTTPVSESLLTNMVTDRDTSLAGDGGRGMSIFHLNESNSFKIDPSDGDGGIILSATFDSAGKLASVHVAASDGGDEGAFGIREMGFTFKPGCEQIAQVDQPGEFGATAAFTDTVNNLRTFKGFSGQEDILTPPQVWLQENACRPFGAVGAISQAPPAKPWTYVAARLSTAAEQCTITDFMQGAVYKLDAPGGPFDLGSIRRLFRKVYGLWTYVKLDSGAGGNTYNQESNAAANPGDQGLSYYNETGTVDPTTLFERTGILGIFGVKAWYPPVVAAVDTTKCDTNGRCKFARMQALTVNGRTDGVLLGADGSLNVTAKFFAWASHNSMPILQRTVLWGDFTAKEPPAKGWYKNQKPFCSPDISDANAVGECSISGLTCDSNADCPNSNTCDKTVGNHFGNTPGACSAGTFQFDHTYTCSLSDLQSMPACTGASDAADNTPCYRTLAGTPTCVYRPKVQIVDNWGWCNCTGSACATDGGAYREGCALDNPPANAKPWTEYVGEIRLAPRVEDAARFVPGAGGSLFDAGILKNLLNGAGRF